MILSSKILTGAVLALSIAAGQAQAAPASNMARIAVQYADLNLNSAQGLETLKARIKGAAHKVCGPEPDSRDLRNSQIFAHCVAQSTLTATASIKVPDVKTAAVNAPAGQTAQ